MEGMGGHDSTRTEGETGCNDTKVMLLRRTAEENKHGEVHICIIIYTK